MAVEAHEGGGEARAGRNIVTREERARLLCIDRATWHCRHGGFAPGEICLCK